MKKAGLLLVAAAFFSAFYFAFKQAPVVVWLPIGDVHVEVPYVPTPTEVVEEMLSVAEVGPEDILYDLGSGDGRIVISAAEKWGTRGVGVEIDPELVRESRKNAKRAHVADLVDFIEEDLFRVDISKATVVTLYLLPDLNLRLRPTLLQALRPGARVVSHSWNMGEWEPDETRVIPSYLEWFSTEVTRFSYVYFWVIPANVSGLWQWREPGKTLNRLQIWQRFQTAEGVLSSPAGEKTAAVEVRGDHIRILAEQEIEGRLQTLVFEGRIRGDIIEGTILPGNGPQMEARPWKAFRLPKTMTPIDKETANYNEQEKKGNS